MPPPRAWPILFPFCTCLDTSCGFAQCSLPIGRGAAHHNGRQLCQTGRFCLATSPLPGAMPSEVFHSTIGGLGVKRCPSHMLKAFWALFNATFSGFKPLCEEIFSNSLCGDVPEANQREAHRGGGTDVLRKGGAYDKTWV